MRFFDPAVLPDWGSLLIIVDRFLPVLPLFVVEKCPRRLEPHAEKGTFAYAASGLD
jgi:hypothetical protein